MMDNILPLKHGSKITIIEMMYYTYYQHQNDYKGNVLYIVYKDENNVKRVKAIPNPKMEIFFTKPEFHDEWKTVRKYIPKDKVYSVVVDANKVLPRIYEEIKKCDDERSRMLADIYRSAIETENYSAKKEIYKFQHAFMSDLQVEEYYRIAVGYNYDTEPPHEVNKAFLDIESDIYKLTTSQLNNDEDPTNAVTVIFDYDITGKKLDTQHVFTFLLKDYDRYPQQKYFVDNMDKFIKQCHDEFDNIKVKKSGKERIVENHAEYHIHLFESEADMLTAVFSLINMVKPDILAVWNIAYDLPKMRARMLHHGLNYVDVMSDPIFPKDSRFVSMNIDKRPGVTAADRKTFIKMTSTTKYIDQMDNYAAIRKGRKNYGSNKLDNIAEIELGIHKREFKAGVDVTNAAILDYWNFILYNINDVWLQVLTDRVTNDMITLVYDSNQTNCAIENLTKQTKYQKQIYFCQYLRKGFVPGNNKNVDYINGKMEGYETYMKELRDGARRRAAMDDSGVDDVEDFDDDGDENVDGVNINSVYEDSIDNKINLMGGLVGHPDKNTANGVELIKGIRSKHIYRCVMDMDYASEYPWAKYTRSISESTQYGRLIIPKKISDRQNEYNVANYIPGSEFISDYISQDHVQLGNTWFNLPTTDEVLDLFDSEDEI